MRNLAEKYFPLIEKLQNSNLTMQAFSERNGINIKTLHYWKRKYRLHNVAVETTRGRPGRPKSGFANLLLSSPEQTAGFSIQYADGTRLFLGASTSSSVIKEF